MQNTLNKYCSTELPRTSPCDKLFLLHPDRRDKCQCEKPCMITNISCTDNKTSSSSWYFALLSLKEYADALSELSPEQSEAHKQSVEKALQAARDLDEIKRNLEEEKRINDEKQKQENEGKKIMEYSWCPVKL